MGDRLDALLAANQRCSDTLAGIITRHKDRDTHIIRASTDEWDDQTEAFAARDAARAALMPTEQDAIRLMCEAFTRLKDLGWNNAIYCPKDGSEFDAIEVGSTGIHKTHYAGEWPTGGWWIAEAGDLWPSSPCLYRPTEKELAAREELRARFRALRDSDRSGEAGETHSGSTEGEGAGPKDIAQAPSDALAQRRTG